MPINDDQRLAEIARKSVNDFKFESTKWKSVKDLVSKVPNDEIPEPDKDIHHFIFPKENLFKSSEPCINRGHKLLISNEENYDLTEFGMAASLVTFDNRRGIHIQHISPYGMCCAVMPAVIGGLKHDILIVDDEYQPKYVDTSFEHEKPFVICANPYSTRKHVNAKELDIIAEMDIPKLGSIKENHPHGWYRKFEKKRF